MVLQATAVKPVREEKTAKEVLTVQQEPLVMLVSMGYKENEETLVSLV